MTTSKKTQYSLATWSDVCTICGTQLTRRSGPGRPRVVCQGECTREAKRRTAADWRANRPKKGRCEVCATELPHSRGCSRFCSPRCRRTAKNVRRKARRRLAAAKSAP